MMSRVKRPTINTIDGALISTSALLEVIDEIQDDYFKTQLMSRAIEGEWPEWQTRVQE
jgi:hypothetical protein